MERGTLKRFEDIDAWQKAREDSKAACAITGEDAFTHDFDGVALTSKTRFALAVHLWEKFLQRHTDMVTDQVIEGYNDMGTAQVGSEGQDLPTAQVHMEERDISSMRSKPEYG
jgi:hypothetical protein